MVTGALDDYDLWLLEASVSGHFSIDELSKMGQVPKSTAYRRVPALVERGFLDSQRRDVGIGRPALVYTITDAGFAELEAYTEELRLTVERLSKLIKGNARASRC